jgi:transcriptional regulator of heat shock response
MVSDRALEVLRVIVQDYIDSKEPVASKAIADRHGFGVSAATIRNDMALLEEEELIQCSAHLGRSHTRRTRGIGSLWINWRG